MQRGRKVNSFLNFFWKKFGAAQSQHWSGSAGTIGAGAFARKGARAADIPERRHLQRPPGGGILQRMQNQPQPGGRAPDFTAVAVGGPHGEGESISLGGLRGRTVALYFYPKDDTPGCTAQACGVRDQHAALLAKGAVVYGISTDSPASHANFIAKHGLPFPLISDESRAIAEAYGVWVEKSMYGKKYMGTERTTFVVDPVGNIRAVLRKTAPAAHAAALLGIL